MLMKKFFYNGSKLEIVNGFQYVGLLFTPTLSMYRTTDDLSKKAKRKLVSMLQTLNNCGQLSTSAFLNFLT